MPMNPIPDITPTVEPMMLSRLAVRFPAKCGGTVRKNAIRAKPAKASPTMNRTIETVFESPLCAAVRPRSEKKF